MRVGPAGIRTFGDPHRLDAFGDRDGRHFLDVLEELLEPAFQIEAVPQHKVGRLCADDIERRRLIVVDLGARLGDGFNDRRRARNVLRDVLDDREGGQDAERFLRLCKRWRAPRAQQRQQRGEDRPPPPPMLQHEILQYAGSSPNWQYI